MQPTHGKAEGAVDDETPHARYAQSFHVRWTIVYRIMAKSFVFQM
jgi:hypothetical protein